MLSQCIHHLSKIGYSLILTWSQSGNLTEDVIRGNTDAFLDYERWHHLYFSKNVVVNYYLKLKLLLTSKAYTWFFSIVITHSSNVYKPIVVYANHQNVHSDD